MATKGKQLKKIHTEALTEFDIIHTAVRDEREQCLQDRRFYAISGAQWEGKLGAQFENKPKFEVNKIHLAVIRVFNQYRNNRITSKFVSKMGDDKSNLGDTCQQLFRSCEKESTASEAYDNAFEEAVGGGIGAWRLCTQYEDEYDEENNEQKIIIEPIYDADKSVFFDLSAKRADKSDAKKCFVISSMSKTDYEEEYGDYVDSWPDAVSDFDYDWHTSDNVFICEYYKKETVREKHHIYVSPTGERQTVSDEQLEDTEYMTELEAFGFEKEKERTIKRSRVRKYILSGGKVLEDCGYIAGDCIPVIPVYGKRCYVDDIERCMGHVRLCKDVQRLKNMLTSKLAEISSESSTRKPILTTEQVLNHEELWAEDNIKNYPYMLLNPTYDQNGNEIPIANIAYTQSADVPQALAALMQLVDIDMKELLGNTDGAEKLVSNISNEAIESIQERLDMQSFIYMDNMAKAIKRSGEVWLGMARDVYVEDGRVIKGLNESEEATHIEINKPVLDDNGEMIYKNNLEDAKFDVDVTIGSSSHTQKESNIKQITELMRVTQDQEMISVLSALRMMNFDIEGVDGVKSYFRKKLVNMGVISPTDKERQELMQAANQPKQPSPQDEYYLAEAERARTEAIENQASSIEKQAKADKARAETAETYANIEQEDVKLSIDAAKAAGERVNVLGQ